MGNNQFKNNKRWIAISTLCVLFFVALGIWGFNSTNNKNINDSQNEAVSAFNQLEDSKASILAVGDVMVHNTQLKVQFNSSTNDYSFDNNFQHVKQYIEEADYAIANLETTLAGNEGRSYSAYPMFNSPDALADGLKYAGFDLISTINNHSFDTGSLGVNRTLEVLENRGFDTVGTRKDSTDDEFIVKNINDINFGITSYSYGEIKDGVKYLNGIRVSDDCYDKMNVFDLNNANEAFNTINSTLKKMEDTDLQIVIIHWGVEYTRTETAFQRELAQKLCDAGVDVIIGSHPHVVEPVETLTSANGESETVVIYSLGNFLSNQSRENVGMYSEDGLMVNIDFVKDNNTNTASVERVTCIPTWVNRFSANGRLNYEIIPIEDNTYLSSIGSLSQSRAEQSYKNTSSLIDTNALVNVVNSPFE